MVKVYMLPVGVGDFLWVRFGQGNQTQHNILIDGGHKQFSYLYKAVIRKIASDKQKTIIILTHIDDDHIQGAAQGLADLSSDLLEQVIDSIYFNTGRGIDKKLHGTSISLTKKMPEDRVHVYDYSYCHSVKDAMTFLDMLEKKGLIRKLIDYIVSGDKIIYEGAELRFISPGEEELEQLLTKWDEYETKIEPHYYSVGLHDSKNISSLKNEKLGYDRSVSNRSSLAFLFEYNDIKGAFLGDACASVLCKGLSRIMNKEQYPIDFLKVPHHGGKYNMSDELIKKLPTSNYLISTVGVPQRDIPSKTLLAHIAVCGNYKLYNNYPWWTDAYHNMFFSNEDMEEYINKGRIGLVKLSNAPVKIKNNLEIYRMFSQ